MKKYLEILISYGVALVSFIIMAVVGTENTITHGVFMGFGIAALVVATVFVIKKVEKNELIKTIGALIILALVFTWIIPIGQYSGAEFVNYGLYRVGLYDFLSTGVYGVNYFISQVLMLLVIGAFYSILAKTKGYGKFVAKVAKFVKGKELITTLVVMAVFGVLASISADVFQIVVLVPFVFHVFKEAKIDKLTTFVATFGGLLIGVLGSTYGGSGVYYTHQYLAQEVTSMIGLRWIIMAASYVLLAGLVVFNKFRKKKVQTETVETALDLEVKKEEKKARIWPYAVMFIFLLAILVLGFVQWGTVLGIDVFTKLDTTVKTFTVMDHTIFGYILGSVPAFGAYDLTSMIVILLFVMLVIKIACRIKFDEILSGFGEGFKVMAKPIVMVALANIIFIFVYWSPFTPTIVDWLMGLAEDGYNVFAAFASGLVTGVFHTDFAFTGYSLGALFANTFADNASLTGVVLTATSGFARLIVPSSVVLMSGLAFANVSYKSWFKYIWKFAVAMFIALLVIFTLVVYAF